MTSSFRSQSPWVVESRGAWSVIAFRPAGPAYINHRDMEQLDALLLDLESDGCRAVVLTGEDDAFIQHADLEDLEAMVAGQAASGDPHAWIRVCKRLDRGPMLSVAAVNGECGGGGLEIALTCSLRIASANARFSFPEAALGLVPAVASHRAIAELSEARVLDLLLTGRVLSAGEALDWGLVSRVCSASSLIDNASNLVEAVIALDPEVVEGIRGLVREGRNPATLDVMKTQGRLWSDLVHRDTGLARLREAIGSGRGSLTRNDRGWD